MESSRAMVQYEFSTARSFSDIVIWKMFQFTELLFQSRWDVNFKLKDKVLKACREGEQYSAFLQR